MGAETPQLLKSAAGESAATKADNESVIALEEVSSDTESAVAVSAVSPSSVSTTTTPATATTTPSEGSVKRTALAPIRTEQETSSKQTTDFGAEGHEETPLTPCSAPVIMPLTVEDTINMASSVERKEEDLSLVVHVDDDMQNDLDNDIVGQVEDAEADTKSTNGVASNESTATDQTPVAVSDKVEAADEEAIDKTSSSNNEEKDDVKAKRLVAMSCEGIFPVPAVV